MKEPKFLGDCQDFSERFNLKSNCCTSSHEDFDLGYEDLERVEVDDGFYLVCLPLEREYYTEQSIKISEEKNKGNPK